MAACDAVIVVVVAALDLTIVMIPEASTVATVVSLLEYETAVPLELVTFAA